MKRSKWLVTGGAGFIGSHIVEYLLKNGQSVVVLDNFCSGKKENLSFVSQYAIRNTRYELIRGDIRDKNDCARACKGVDYISHQAALRSVPKSMEEPQSYNDVNIGGTLTLLTAARVAKVKRFVMASSSSVYGDATTFPEREDMYPLLISPYALSKLANEYYCRIFSEHYGLETACLRYFNVFGPRQALDDEYAVVIPKFTTCILKGEQPPVFGNGKQSRDFTYIDNVVQANVLAATAKIRNTQYAIRNTKKVFHEVFNVANGRDTTLLELIAALNKIVGKNIKPKFLPIRAGDVFRTSADISKIQKIIGYKPLVKFEEGLRRVVEYWRARV